MWLLAIIVLLVILTISGMVYWFGKCPACPACPACPYPACPIPVVQDAAIARDRAVLSDQLYPPQDRMDRITYNELRKRVIARDMYVATQDIGDTYRLLGYLTGEFQEPRWKLFGRQKDRNNGEFYVVSTDKTVDLKLPLRGIKSIPRLTRTDSLPDSITFQHAILGGSYTIVQLPQGDLSETEYL